METPRYRRTWIEIDLDKLIENYHTACSLTKATVTCVLKSNAYGHGAIRVAEALMEAGCRSFAVSCAREAIELRNAGIQGEILVMGTTEPEYLPDLIQAGCYITVACLNDIADCQEAARTLQRKAAVHIKIDTGMHRLGFASDGATARDIAICLSRCPLVDACGLFSHLALTTRERDQQQYDALISMQKALAEHGVVISDVHLCDSIGLVRYPEWHGSRVRVGALLYGVRPSRSEHMPFACHETAVLKTTISQIHEVKAGDFVGYSDDQPLTHDARIATLCAGYGDGYPRSLSNGRGKVLIRGKRAPVEGIVCMDQLMVDVTDIPEAKPGDAVTLLGGGIAYDEYAEWANTNRNECITILSRRPVRVYHRGGKIATVLDSMLNERRDF